MTSVDFPQRNCIIAEEQPEYLPLFAYHNGTAATVCLQLDESELAELQATGKLWLTQWTFGAPYTPINISTKNPF